MKNKLSNKAVFLYLLAGINILFLLVFELGLKNFLLEKIFTKSDPMDITYYSDIFNNLGFAVIVFTIVSSVFIIGLNKCVEVIIKQFTEKRLLFYSLFLNAVIQLILVLTIKSLPIADSKYYVQHAQSLIATGSYLNEWGHYTAFWPIGLPALLRVYAFISPDVILMAKLFNILINSLYIYVIYRLFAGELTEKQRVLLLAVLILFPNNLFSSNIIMGDYIFSLLLWFAVFLNLKFKENLYAYISIGIIAGLMSYIRPTGLLFPLIIFIVIFDKNNIIKSVKHISVVILLMLVTLAPWIYRNYEIFHSLVPVSTNGGYNFLMGNHCNATGGVNFTFPYDIQNPDEVAEGNKAYRTALGDMQSNPVKAIIRLPKKIVFSYLRGDSSITWALKSTESPVLPVIKSISFYFANCVFYIVIFLSILSYIRNRKSIEKKQLSKYMMLIYLYFIFVILMYVGSERYIITILPLHFFYAVKYE
jgi:hypothetical protein